MPFWTSPKNVYIFIIFRVSNLNFRDIIKRTTRLHEPLIHTHLSVWFRYGTPFFFLSRLKVGRSNPALPLKSISRDLFICIRPPDITFYYLRFLLFPLFFSTYVPFINHRTARFTPYLAILWHFVYYWSHSYTGTFSYARFLFCRLQVTPLIHLNILISIKRILYSIFPSNAQNSGPYIIASLIKFTF